MKRTSLLLVIAQFVLMSCAMSESKEAISPSVSGKFVFDRAVEDLGLGSPHTYEPATGTIKKIGDQSGFPTWSPDGKKIASCDMDNKSILIHSESGELVQAILCPKMPYSIVWLPEGNGLIYAAQEAIKRKIPDTYYLYIYHFESKAHEELKDFEQDYELYDLTYCDKLKILGYEISSTVNDNIPSSIRTYSMTNRNERVVYGKGVLYGFYPDGINLLIGTNTDPRGQLYPDRYGVIAKLNIDTGDMQILFRPTENLAYARLSHDGKFLVYSKLIATGGQAVFIRNLETHEETQITTPVKNSKGEYSIDAYPDWFQG